MCFNYFIITSACVVNDDEEALLLASGSQCKFCVLYKEYYLLTISSCKYGFILFFMIKSFFF